MKAESRFGDTTFELKEADLRTIVALVVSERGTTVLPHVDQDLLLDLSRLHAAERRGRAARARHVNVDMPKQVRA